MAETEGFEPSIRLTAYDDLANRCLQPLGHVSALLPFGFRFNLGRAEWQCGPKRKPLCPDFGFHASFSKDASGLLAIGTLIRLAG